MTQRVDLRNIPDDLKERVQFARDWWDDDETRRLPGEERLNTVFVIEYYDGCKYFGYTKEHVAYRVATLSAYIGGWAPPSSSSSTPATSPTWSGASNQT